MRAGKFARRGNQPMLDPVEKVIQLNQYCYDFLVSLNLIPPPNSAHYVRRTKEVVNIFRERVAELQYEQAEIRALLKRCDKVLEVSPAGTRYNAFTYLVLDLQLLADAVRRHN